MDGIPSVISQLAKRSTADNSNPTAWTADEKLLPAYTCPTCGVTLEYRKLGPLGSGYMQQRAECPCETAAREASEQEEIRRITRASMRASSGIPIVYRRKSFADILDVPRSREPRPGARSMTEVVEIAKRYVEEFPGRWLILSGAAGCGKSLTASAIANALIDERIAVQWANWPRVEQIIPKTWNDPGPPDPIPRLLAAQLIVLDELPKIRVNDWPGRELYRLVNECRLSNRQMLITTNVSLRELLGAVGDRIADRIIDGSQWVDVDADSYRLRRFAESKREAMR
jgi:DNA replication protein DnaC